MVAIRPAGIADIVSLGWAFIEMLATATLVLMRAEADSAKAKGVTRKVTRETATRVTACCKIKQTGSSGQGRSEAQAGGQARFENVRWPQSAMQITKLGENCDFGGLDSC